MKQALFFLTTAAVLLLLFPACKPDPVKQIPELEKALENAYSQGKADSLEQLYLAAVKAHPEDHLANLHFLTKAAELKFLRKKDAVGAVRIIDQAIKNHGTQQNLTEPVGLLARIWYAYQYKSTVDLSKKPGDIDLMRAHLEKNLVWIDSSLNRLDQTMGGVAVSDKPKAEAFIQIAEAYALLIQARDTTKYVNLILQAAGLAKTIGNPNKALQLYFNVGEKMPDHPKAPTALFMEAFIYENDLQDIEKAKATYEMFLNRYPNDPDYADDAQNALKLLGKSPEEIIRQFEQSPQ